MRLLLVALGILAYWLGWPIVWLYLHGSTRTRVLIICDNQFLAVKSWVGAGAWVLPGGGLRVKELPVRGAIREVYEETGILLRSEQLEELGRGYFSQHGLGFKYISYEVQLNAKPSTNTQKFEISSLCWIPLNKVHSFKLSKDVNMVIEQWKQGR